MLQRVMELADSNQQIRIEIDQPQWPQADTCSCDYRIVSGGQISISHTVFGADEIQAVMIVFDALRQQLNEHFPTATWLGGLQVEMAFPRAIPIATGFDTYKEIEALAEKHIEDKYGLP